jgi:dipeptidyl aminopeptidase/acylaminoacyl peptidase
MASSGSGRPHRRRRVIAGIALVAVVIVLAAATYVGGGYLAYQQLAVAEPQCAGRPFAVQTPADFTLDAAGGTTLDAAPYRFSDWTDIEFPSRGTSLTIRGWFAEPRHANGPTVILVHGYNSCRRDWNVLLPAGMLHRAGFGVLLLDLRNHGDSDSDGGRWAGGAKEYRDVLGAWDWLRARDLPAERIGIFGASLGAATTTIAMGEEPNVRAAWADSSYASYATAASEYAQEKGYPGWVANAAIPVAHVLGDPELDTREPGAEVLALRGRPFFIVHGLADTTILPHNAVELAVAAAAGGSPVEPWLVPGAEHTREMLVVPERYEQRLVEFFTDTLGAP